MAQQSPDSYRPNGNLPNTKQIDLRGQGSYAASIEWVRNNLVLGKTPEGTVLQLDVLLPDGSVSLFMDPRNQYILGFRGFDAAYVLKDDASRKFIDALRAVFRDTMVDTVDIGTGHGPEGLGTFSGHGQWPETREFSLGDLREAKILSTYSKSRKNVDHERLKKALSLFVHMISESARIPMLESSFTHRFYLGSKVSADLAVRSFKDAQEIIGYAYRFFPQEQRYQAVERVQKRAAHMDLVLTRIEGIANRKDRAALIVEILNGHAQADRSVTPLYAEFRDICEKLKLSKSDAKLIKEMITTCKSDDAVFAAKQGVVTPDIHRNL